MNIDDWFYHDNLSKPAWLDDDSTITAIMGDGSKCFGRVGDFDWTHDDDPVIRFTVRSVARPQ